MEKLFRIIWLIVSTGLAILIIVKLIDIGVSVKYEIEEPLINGENPLLLEKKRLFDDQIFILKIFLFYIFFSLIFQVRSIVRLASKKIKA
jgi:hypothetical protein